MKTLIVKTYRSEQFISYVHITYSFGQHSLISTHKFLYTFILIIMTNHEIKCGCYLA